jgi:hypothetical protein
VAIGKPSYFLATQTRSSYALGEVPGG